MEKVAEYFKIITRTKSISYQTTRLQPVLTIFSLTFLGLGQTVGTGLFILSGIVAREYAGPSVVVSFLMAAVISCPTAFFYAEFGCRFRQTGSSYIYTYSSVGEIYAFVVGWNMILALTFAASAQGRTIIDYMDVILNGTLEKFNEDLFGEIDLSGIPYSFNTLGFLLIILVTFILLTGTKGTAYSNNILISIKLVSALFIIIAGGIFSNIVNWSVFMPHGIHGVIKGTAVCFIAYMGLDGIANASEEARDAKRTVPLAIFLCFCITCVLYVGVSAVLTLMVPHYKLSFKAPLIHAFEQVGLPWAKYIVFLSGVTAMLTVLISTLFSSSRIIYSMACDGLVFKYFSEVGKKIVVPIRAIVVSGLISALVTFFLDLDSIVDMITLGILVSYIFVAISILLVRFTPEKPSGGHVLVSRRIEKNSGCSWFAEFLWRRKHSVYNKLQDDQENEKRLLMQKNWKIVCICIALMVVMMVIVLSILNFALSSVVSGSPGVVAALVLSSLVLICSIVPLFYLPRHQVKFDFTVPMVPLTPIIAIALDIFLILNLQWLTWIRAILWILLGSIIYFLYGVRNSVQGKEEESLRFIHNFSPRDTDDDDDTMDIVSDKKR